MSETLKEKALEKAFDIILDFIFSYSVDDIKEILDKNKHQKILYKVIHDFALSVYFREEYNGILYIDDQDAVLSILSDSINPAQTTAQIYNAIKGIIKKCFVTTDEEAQESIGKYISSLYLQKAKITTEIYDVLPVLRENFDNIDDVLGELKQLIKDNDKRERELRYEREVILKTELHSEIINDLNDIMQSYLFMMVKKSPTYDGSAVYNLSNAMAIKIREVIDNIDLYVQADFINTPILLTVFNDLEKEEISISYMKFSEHHFRAKLLSYTSKLMNYENIMDSESFIAILRLRNAIQSNLFPPLDTLGLGSNFNTKNIKLDCSWARKIFCEIGENILILHRNLL